MSSRCQAVCVSVLDKCENFFKIVSYLASVLANTLAVVPASGPASDLA